MDVTAISGMISGLKAAAELAKLAINARDAAIVRAKAIELERDILAAYSNALTAQADQFALLSRVRELEKEAADFKAWNAEKEKYELAKPSPHKDVFAYILKGGTSEPRHYICANCYEDRVKSILQKETRTPLAEVLVCPRCCTDIYLTGEPSPSHAAAKKSPRRPR